MGRIRTLLIRLRPYTQLPSSECTPASELACFDSIVLAFLPFISHLPQRPPPKKKRVNSNCFSAFGQTGPRGSNFHYHDTEETCF